MTKAKYKLYIEGILRYWFVTTSRNTEDCINVLQEMFDGILMYAGYYRIDKIQNGTVETVFQKQPHKWKRVIDTDTGKVYRSISECARENGFTLNCLWSKLKKNKTKFKYAS